MDGIDSTLLSNSRQQRASASMRSLQGRAIISLLVALAQNSTICVFGKHSFRLEFLCSTIYDAMYVFGLRLLHCHNK